MDKKGLVGDLHSMPFPDVFQWISMANKSGELFIQYEAEDALIIFKNGRIVYASSNVPKFLLGQILLRYKMITKDQLIKALGFQKKNRKPLGQILIEAKIIDKKQLEKALRHQIEEIVYYLLSWDVGYFNFSEKEINVNTNTAISVDELLMEGIRRADELKMFFNYFNESSIIEVNDKSKDEIKLFDGKKCVREVLEGYGGDSFNVYKKIYEGIKDKTYKVIGEKDFQDFNGESPVISFLVALELFNKGKIYESYKKIAHVVSSGYKNEQILRFFENLKIFIDKYFQNKYGGDNSLFTVNKTKLLNEKIYITPTEGFVLTRIEEYPYPAQLKKVLHIDKSEIYLIIDKLYRYGFLLLKGRQKNVTDRFDESIFAALLKVYKNELTGEMEVITDTLTSYFVFSSGKFIFAYSQTDEFSLKDYLIKSGKLKDEQLELKNDIEKCLDVLISNSSDVAKTNVKAALSLYSEMIFYETIKCKPISIIFSHDKSAPYNIKLNLNLLNLLSFALISFDVGYENNIDFSMSYELIKDKSKIVGEFGETEYVNRLLDEFNGNILSAVRIKRIDKKLIGVLNIFFELGYIREYEEEKLDITKLKDFLKIIKNKKPEDIFSVSKDHINLEDIKQKFLKFSKHYHPDLFENEEAKKYANEIFEIIKFAYDKLTKENFDATSSEERIDAKKIFSAEQYLSSGKVYINMGKLFDGVEAFKKAYENFPYDDEIKGYFAFALIKEGKVNDGYEILKNINIELFDDPELYFAYIDAAIKLKYYKEAQSMLKRLITKFPEQLRRVSYYQQKLKS